MLRTQRRQASLLQSVRLGRLVADIFTYAMVLFAIAVIAIPFIWMFLAAFKTPAELFTTPPVWLPGEWRWSHRYRQIFF